MNASSQAQTIPSSASAFQSKLDLPPKLNLPQQVALICAVMSTLASVAIAIYAGWQTGGTVIEQFLRIIVAIIAVLYVHWMPIRWKFFGLPVRIAAVLLWAIALIVVTYGQITFVMNSQKHSGNLHAAALEVPPADPPSLGGRSRTEIANDLTKITTELARTEVRRCVGDCPGLKVLKVRLTEEIGALKTEDDEAKRRDQLEDRNILKADRLEELRTIARRDAVASEVSSWLGTTEYFVQLMIGLAHAVALEGIAMIAWMILSVLPSRDAGLNSSRATVLAVGEVESAAPDAIVTISRESRSAKDERRLSQVKTAIAEGEIVQSQEAIRKLTGCGQEKAKWLNREYSKRYGSVTV